MDPWIIIMIVYIMVKMAGMYDRSKITWGGITLIICIFSLLIPLPYLNMAIGGVISYLIFAVTGFGQKVQ